MKEILLVLMETLVHQKKSLVLILVKQKQKPFLSLHYNGHNSYFSVNGKEICKFKASDKNINFPTQFYLGIISNKLNYVYEEEVSLKANVYHFPIDYNAINKSDILDIHKYLLVKKIQNKTMFKSI